MDEVNRNRLEELRQLKREIRHSEEYLIVGIDIAKDRIRGEMVSSLPKQIVFRVGPRQLSDFYELQPR